jgi:hypothetical protein
VRTEADPGRGIVQGQVGGIGKRHRRAADTEYEKDKSGDDKFFHIILPLDKYECAMISCSFYAEDI